MANVALSYAENTLGVHACYERANQARSELDSILADLDKAQDERRIYSDRLNSREMELLITERGKHADMSEAALDRKMKVVKHMDNDLIELRAHLSRATGQVNGLEYDAEVQKHIIKIECARMEELSGYLRYLAVIKEAENLAKINQEKP